MAEEISGSCSNVSNQINGLNGVKSSAAAANWCSDQMRVTLVKWVGVEIWARWVGAPIPGLDPGRRHAELEAFGRFGRARRAVGVGHGKVVERAHAFRAVGAIGHRQGHRGILPEVH